MIAQPPIRSVTQPLPSRPSVTTPAPFRELPHDSDIEAYLLSACLIDGPAVIPMCVMAGIDRADKFYDTKHGLVFAVLLDLYAANKPTTIDILAAELTRRKEIEAVGGYSFLTQISTRIPTTAEAPAVIEAFRAYSLRRALIRSRTESIEQAYNTTNKDIDAFLSELLAAEATVTANGSNLSEETVPEVCDALLAELNLPKSQRTGTVGECSWGVMDIDKTCGKMAPGTLNILAAQPSGGKSALAQQAAWSCAKDGRAAIYFSYEMLKRDVVVRIAQQVSSLNLDRFDGAPIDHQLRFTGAVREIQKNKNLYVFERDTTLNRISARVRTIHQKTPVGLIVVDFLQYLSRLEPTLGKERTDEKLGRITGSLKQIAKECDCPVLLLSSLNREGYKTEAKPNLASLRSSGEIESDADVVMFLHWPKEHGGTGQEQDPHDGSQSSFWVDVLQEKGRNKGVHQVGVVFNRSATRFDNYVR